jgi:uncharacterized protein involved in type VI secretion and phage assembly
MTLLQDDRLIRISTNLGENAFVVLSFIGTEKISGLFSFDLLLASEQNDIRFEQLAGKNATVAIGGQTLFQRHHHRLCPQPDFASRAVVLEP